VWEIGLRTRYLWLIRIFSYHRPLLYALLSYPTTMKPLYLTSPLFSIAERRFNQQLRDKIEQGS